MVVAKIKATKEYIIVTSVILSKKRRKQFPHNLELYYEKHDQYNVSEL